jgi:peptidoglycan hydrolase-like protein with peptidoglycan-binding domain
MRTCIILLLAACSHTPTTETVTTDYLYVEQGGKAWPVNDQALTLAVKERLKAQGYDPGPIDGVADEQSTQALIAFQRGRGLAVTGVLDEDTARALGLRWRQVRRDVRAGRLESPSLPVSGLL